MTIGTCWLGQASSSKSFEGEFNSEAASIRAYQLQILRDRPERDWLERVWSERDWLERVLPERDWLERVWSESNSCTIVARR